MKKRKQSVAVEDVPTEEEIAEAKRARAEENRSRLGDAVALARELFPGDRVTAEVAIAIGQVIEGGVDRSFVRPLVDEATAFARRLGDANPKPETALALLDVLLDDKEYEGHLADALAETRKYFGEGAGVAQVLDVYYQIYGEDEAALEGFE